MNKNDVDKLIKTLESRKFKKVTKPMQEGWNQGIDESIEVIRITTKKACMER